MAEELRTRFAAVVQIDVAALTGTIAGLEELPVRGGRRPVAPQSGMRVLRMPVGDAGLGQLVSLRPGMEDPFPGNLLRAHSFRGRRHAPGAEVGRIGQYPGQHRRNAAWRILSTDVREPIGKPSPGMHFHQEIRHFDQR